MKEFIQSERKIKDGKYVSSEGEDFTSVEVTVRFSPLVGSGVSIVGEILKDDYLPIEQDEIGKIMYVFGRAAEILSDASHWME